MAKATIDKKTITFLKNVKKNNNREWFQKNKGKYEDALDNIKIFVQALEAEMNKHDVIEKSKIFRIYRDVRFSKDKSPYKTNFAIFLSRAGTHRRGGYYLHLEPGSSMIGGGFWKPEPADLKRIRKEFEMDDKPMRKIMNSATFKKHFGTLKGDSVKTAPKGFDKDHPAIDLIRMKSFVVSKDIKDMDITGDKFLSEVNTTFKAMRKYFDYMSEVLTTDLNGVSLLK